MADLRLDFTKILNRLILFIAIGVTAHIVFVLSTTEKHTLSLLTNVSIWHIIGILVCMILPWFGTAARMYIWSGFLNEKIAYLDAVRVVVISEVASALSPTAVGGTPIRAALLINRGFGKGNVGFILSYSIVEDLVFYATGVLLAIFVAPDIIRDLGSIMAMFVSDHYVALAIGLVTVIGVFRVVSYYRRTKKTNNDRPASTIRSKVTQTLRSMANNFSLAWQSGKSQILTSLVILFAQWMAKLTILVILFDAFDVRLDASMIYIKQWLTYVMMLLVPTPGATGGAEASFLLMFKTSVPSDISYLIVSTWRLFTYYFILLIAVAFYLVLSFVFGVKEEVTIGETHSR
jgi:glycosyltransferase 2 family protein